MKGRVAAAAAIALSLVLVVLWQCLFVSSINLYIVSVAVLLLSMLPFVASFESRKADAREITLIATMIALCVASRAAFYLIPQVKPIGAIVVIAGVCLGAERGSIVGAFSAFISNFIFGQGIWTPFQMVALGMVGLLSGLIFKVVRANRFSLAAVGLVLTFALYGAIVDMSTVLSALGSSFNLHAALTVYAAGIPFSLIFGVSTAVFLAVFGEAFIKKLDRVINRFDILIHD